MSEAKTANELRLIRRDNHNRRVISIQLSPKARHISLLSSVVVASAPVG